MKSLATWSALVLALASAVSGAPAPTPAPTKLKAHGMTVNGRIPPNDRPPRPLTAPAAAAQPTPISWPAAPRIAGGELKAGGAVTVRYLDKDSKHIATYIRINGGESRASSPSTAPLPVAQTPTPLTRGL
jgi:hypothetical protein